MANLEIVVHRKAKNEDYNPKIETGIYDLIN